MRYILLGVSAAALAVPAYADPVDEEPMLIVPQEQQDGVQYLPANTELVVALNDTLTTKGNSLNEGDTFGLTVQHNVYLQDVVVIPKGSRATGRVTWLTSKGAFGKSGKMEIEVEYVEVNGRRIPLEGQFRQEGEGNTVATVGGVIAAGLFAGFITGKSGVIPRGRELTVRTKDALPVRIAQRAAPPPYQPASYGQTEMAAASVPAPQPARAQRTRQWGLEAVEPN